MKSKSKQIVKINKDTKEIVEEYPHLSFAANKLNVSPGTLAAYITCERVFDDKYYLQYKDEIHDWKYDKAYYL